MISEEVNEEKNNSFDTGNYNDVEKALFWKLSPTMTSLQVKRRSTQGDKDVSDYEQHILLTPQSAALPAVFK